MKLFITKMKSLITAAAIIFASVTHSAAQDHGWPRQANKDGATLVIYQPQVDEWKNFTDLDFRFAFTLTPPAGKQFVGVAVLLVFRVDDGGTMPCLLTR